MMRGIMKRCDLYAGMPIRENNAMERVAQMEKSPAKEKTPKEERKEIREPNEQLKVDR